MSYVATVTGTTSVSANARTYTLPSTGVAVGDLVLAVIPIVGHLLSPGYDTYQSARLALPARWVWIGAQTVQRGGDPARLQEAVLVAALIAESSDVGATFTFTSLSESPLPDSTWESSYPVKPHGHVFRGEVGVNAAHWAALTSPASSITPAEGWSPDGTGTDVIEAFAPHTYTATSTGSGTTIAWSPSDFRIANKAGGHPSSFDTSTLVSDSMNARALFDVDTAASVLALAGTLTVSGTRSPLKPVVTSPAAGAVIDARMDSVTLAWAYLASTAGAPTGYAIRRSYGSTTEYWSGSAWQTSEVIIASSASSATLPGGTAWTYGTTYQLSVACKGFTGARGEYSDPVTISVAAAPTLTVTVQGEAADGTVATTTPTLVGSATPGAGLSVIAWEAEIVDAGGVVVASTSQLGNLPVWASPVVLVNGAIFTGRMRVQQTGGGWSAWVSNGFKVVSTAFAGSSSTVRLQTHPVSGAPGIAVYVGFSGAPIVGTTVELQRSVDAGVTWVTVRTGTPVPAGQAWVLVDDYAAPTAASILYRARGTATLDGKTTVGDWVTIGPIVMSSGLAGWLVDPTRPELAVRTDLIARDADDYDTGSVAYQLIGRRTAVVAHGTATDATRKVTIRTDNRVELDAVLALVTSGNPLILRWCAVDTPSGSREQLRDTTGIPVGHVAVDWVRGTSRANVAFTLVDQDV